MAIDFPAVLAVLIPQLLTLLGLSLAQVVLGIAVSLKNKLFEWQKVGDFFGTIIIPRVLGWFVIAVIVLVVPKEYLSPEISTLAQGGAFAFVLLSFAGSIIANLRALGFLSENTVLDKVGLPAATNNIAVIATIKPVDAIVKEGDTVQLILPNDAGPVPPSNMTK